jgi:ribosomal protein L11 methyltransferase
MAWLQVILSTDANSAESISEILSEEGAVAVTLYDGGDMPLFEQDPNIAPLWDQTVIVGLFEEPVDTTALSTALNIALMGLAYNQLRFEKLADADWERAWMDRFQPMYFGHRLWVCPSWHEAPDPTAVIVKLDPGMAFGTGTHATTALMLEWLAGAVLQNKRVIDYGTGSGILAIAAAKLGAQHVLAVDNDPKALNVAENNCSANGVNLEEVTLCLHGQVPSYCGDILIANILAEPLKSLAELFARLVKPQGTILLSGILSHQAEAVCAAYAPWFECYVGATRDEWVRVEGRRRVE